MSKKMTAKEFIEKKFFKGYPQHESDYIGDKRLKDIELLMNQYTLHIAEQAVQDEKNEYLSDTGDNVCDRILSRIKTLTK